MKRLSIIALSISILIGVGAAPIASAAAPYCGITWGSLAKSAPDASDTDTIMNVRTGRNTCYDRMVVDISNPNAGYDVQYVPNVYAEGSGQLIPLAGGAKLQIVVKSPSYDPATGLPTYPGISGQPLPGVDLTGYQTFRDAKFAGSFEGQSTIGLGVRAHLPFRVFKLDNRIVIDVAHMW